MANGKTRGILQWLDAHCAAHRYRSGSRRREQLLRKLGCVSGASSGCRLPCGTWRAHGEATYRRFKWDPAQVPPKAQVLCKQLALLELSLSLLARRFDLGPAPASLPSRPASPRPPTLGAGATAARPFSMTAQPRPGAAHPAPGTPKGTGETAAASVRVAGQAAGREAPARPEADRTHAGAQRAMADLLDCLAGARRAREAAERHIAAGPPNEPLDDLLGGRAAPEVLVLRPRRAETA